MKIKVFISKILLIPQDNFQTFNLTYLTWKMSRENVKIEMRIYREFNPIVDIYYTLPLQRWRGWILQKWNEYSYLQLFILYN